MSFRSHRLVYLATGHYVTRCIVHMPPKLFSKPRYYLRRVGTGDSYNTLVDAWGFARFWLVGHKQRWIGIDFISCPKEKGKEIFESDAYFLPLSFVKQKDAVQVLKELNECNGMASHESLIIFPFYGLFALLQSFSYHLAFNVAELDFVPHICSMDHEFLCKNITEWF